MNAEDEVIETQFFLKDSFFVHGRKLRGDRIYMPNGSTLASTAIPEFAFACKRRASRRKRVTP